jgi:large repetitive protein
MRVVSAERILLLATAAVSLSWGQAPNITSLQSSRINSEAADVTGVTSGTASLANGFVLYLNGTFHPGNVLNVRWLNTSTNVTTLFDTATLQVSPAQISLIVPFPLFSTVVANPVPVTVTVTEIGGASSATYTINPPLQSIAPILPAGTLNQSYTTSFTSGGTPPFLEAGLSTSATLPPGLNNLQPPVNNTITGTPTQTGVFNFQPFALDFWGNQVIGDDTIEIVDVPTVTSLSPNSSGSGAGNLTITVNGTNFVGPVTVGAQQIPGSQVRWVGQVVTPLVTTFVNANQLTAVVPAALLATPGAAAVAVVQPSNVSSIVGPASAFIVNPPSLSSVLPVSVPAGSGATALSVLGANFVVNGSQLSTVSLTGTSVPTSFVNTGALTALVPAAMLNSPAQFSVQVTNPGGAVSATLGFSVLAPVITTLSSVSIPAGSPDLQLTVTGSSYLSGSQVSFRGTPLTATLVNNTLVTTVPANLLTAPGQVAVQVINPGGAVSNTVLFTVLGPVLTSISPNAMPVGSPGFQLVANGGSFISGSQILFNGTALTTAFLSSTFVSATVPANLIASTGQFDVKVQNPGGATTLDQIFTVVSPAITSISPTSIAAGAATFTLTVNGNNFAPGSQVLFDGTALVTTNGGESPTPLFATVPAAMVSASKVASIVVANPGVSGNLSVAASFTVIGSLSIVTTALPPGTTGSNYSAALAGRGGAPPYTWSASGFPPSLSINTSTGVISGVLQISGTFPVTVVLQDSVRASVSAQFPLVVSVVTPPVSIAPSSSVPSGVVGVPYTGLIFGNGGTAPYTFSLGGGSLPDGLTLSSGGAISGTPKTPGQSSFSVVATSSTGATGSASFVIVIQPAPLTLTGAPPVTASTGTPISVTFGGTGGVGPYRFTPGGSLPPGTSFTNGVLSGTLTTAGAFTFNVTLADSIGGVVTRSFTLTVTAPASTPPSLGGSLSDGKVGVPYSGQLSATGGTPPYTYTGSGLPDGLSLSPSGAISGTPATAGKFSLAATVTDSKGVTANAVFGINIAIGDLTIVTASLPDGVVGVAYAANLSASGGVPPYTWTVSGLPDGVSATPAGVISGTPKTAGKFTVGVTVKDGTPGSAAPSKSYSVTIAPPQLVITTASAPNGTVGTAYTASFAASGGDAPLTFSAIGLPAGLTMSAAGTISGTPTAPVAATIVVTVKDAVGASTSKSYAVTIALPPTPPLTYSGVSATSPPLQQPILKVSLGSPYPVDVIVTLTLSFAPDSGPDDPAIQFSTGGRTARITVPAGSTNGATEVGVQTGSVAGVITIVSQMLATGQDVTPSPAPRTTIRIAAGAPVITTVTAVRNGTGFTVTITGYVTDREMTQAAFAFAAASGSNLQTTTLTVPLDTLTTQYFSGQSAIPFGGQFTFTQAFTVTGNLQAVVSVTVTLTNKIGQSTPATATLN